MYCKHLILLFFFIFINASNYCNISQQTKGKIYTPSTYAQFKEIIMRHDLVVVDFYADWCMPCKHMNKIIDSFAQDHDLDSILFVKINTRDHASLTDEYHVYMFPTLILFFNGTIINTIYGDQDKKTVKQIILDTFF